MSYADLQQMLVGLRESQSVATKLEAGEVLANAGWAIFPLPNNLKFDKGLSYLHATIDPARWREMAEWQMKRTEGRDVNIALAPAKCVVPLLVIDLDGAPAIAKFFEDATQRGHLDVPTWLRVNTTRTDHGRHVYFAAPDGASYANSQHRWGGEVRSGKGHVVMPPSTTESGRYTWAGENLYTAPQWIVEGLTRARTSNGARRLVTDDEIDATLEVLSLWSWTSYGEAAVAGLVDELRGARPGDQATGRNATLARCVYRVLDLALERQAPATEMIARLADTYETLFDASDYASGRVPMGEVVRCVRSWFNNKEDLETALTDNAALARWASQRAGTPGGMQEADEAARDVLDRLAEASSTAAAWVGGRRTVAKTRDWHARLGK